MGCFMLEINVGVRSTRPAKEGKLAPIDQRSASAAAFPCAQLDSWNNGVAFSIPDRDFELNSAFPQDKASPIRAQFRKGRKL